MIGPLMITVLGASGFIGSNLVRYLERSGVAHTAVQRGQHWPAGPLGHVIYCIGVTADFRQRPFDAVDAHVCALLDFVREASFESLLYLSSTRLYQGSDGVAREDDDICVNPLRFEDLYNISKAMGESIVLSLGAKGRVVRPSNVYGRGQTDSFLASVLSEAENHGSLTLRSSRESARDYVSVDDVSPLLLEIALRGRERVYNLASGTLVTNAELAAFLTSATGCPVSFAPDASTATTPRIDNERICTEFGFRPALLMNDLPSLIGKRE
jgi:nucleoside-diphosphate-sugar epimerase